MLELEKKSIAERGWYPLNRNLLIDTKLRSTMTVEEATEEKDTSVIIPYHTTEKYVEINDTAPTFNPMFLPTPTATTDRPNLKDGMAA